MKLTPPEPQIHAALCIHQGEDDNLELRKAYAVLPPAANETGYLRVIDESGEDYLYPTDCFALLELPRSKEAFKLGLNKGSPRL